MILKNLRMLLPEGFSELRQDVGKIIRERRMAHEFGTGLSQQELAEIAGIARENLSRIENGRQWPSYDALCKIMGLFDLEWDHIAYKSEGARPARRYAPERRQNLGNALRIGRLHEGITLEELAGRTGLSCSQLSRVERSQSIHSRLLEVIDARAPLTADEEPDPVFQFVHPELALLAEIGRALLEDERI